MAMFYGAVEECYDEALARIEAERVARTGTLDLNEIRRLQCLPPEIAGLRHLHSLEFWGNRISDLSPLAQLSALQSLVFHCTPVSDLSPLAQLSALQSLVFQATQVSDLSPLAQLSALQSLVFHCTPVSDLSPLAQLSALQSLVFHSTPVSDLSPLAQLSALQSLNFHATQVSDLSPLAQLSALQSLDFQRTPVSDLSPLAQLSALQSLNFDGAQVSDLSPLAQLSTLQSLNFDGAQVSDLSPLAQLSTLQSLSFQNTPVSDLSPLAQLSALQSLGFAGTQISDLSPLAQLTALQFLDFQDTQVSDLSPLAQLSALQSLDFQATQVSDLSPLAQLTALQFLDFQDTQVSDLSPLAQLTALQSLDFQDTQVSDLSPLTQLSALQSLNFARTEVSDLAPILALPNLQKLDVDGCHLLPIPASFFMRPVLQEFFAYQTTLPNIPAEVLSQGYYDNCLPQLRAHLTDLQAGAEPISSAKLMLLGNGRVGKTQLCRRLRGMEYDERIASTHGIQVASHALEYGQWHIWDFGGQEIYHSTHALFMQSRAVVVLVWSPETDDCDTHQTHGMQFRNHKLEYWVRYVRQTSGNACPLIIVQTRCEQPQIEVRQLPLPAGLLEDFAYCKILQYSSANNRGRVVLDATLRDAHQWLMQQHAASIGLGRLRVQNALCAWCDADNALPDAEKHHRTVSQQEFVALCEAGEGDVSSPAALLDYLHHAGMVFYRENMFSEQIILDQAWALDAIYTVFNRESCLKPLRKWGGRFSRSDLASLAWQGFSVGEQQLFLSMMCSCGIAFVYRQANQQLGIEAEYIAPDLLPDKATLAQQLEEKWDSQAPTQFFDCEFEVQNTSLLRSLIAQIGTQAGINALYWQGGVCVYESSTKSRALIEQIAGGQGEWSGCIRISTQGREPQRLLDALKHMLERETGDVKIAVKPAASAQPESTADAGLHFVAEPLPGVHYGVSYAWNSASDAVVDELCTAAQQRGIHILRDKTTLGIGDRITPFMQKLGAQDKVFVILSEKYLQSPFCMFELFEIWRNCRQQPEAFLRVVQVFCIGKVDIFSPKARLKWALHWKQEHDELDAMLKGAATSLLGAKDYKNFKRMQEFAQHTGDILQLVADTLLPQDFAQLLETGLI